MCRVVAFRVVERIEAASDNATQLLFDVSDCSETRPYIRPSLPRRAEPGGAHRGGQPRCRRAGTALPQATYLEDVQRSAARPTGGRRAWQAFPRGKTAQCVWSVRGPGCAWWAEKRAPNAGPASAGTLNPAWERDPGSRQKGHVAGRAATSQVRNVRRMAQLTTGAQMLADGEEVAAAQGVRRARKGCTRDREPCAAETSRCQADGRAEATRYTAQALPKITSDQCP